MQQNNCPTLENYIAGDQCMENLAGMGSTVYAFQRNKLKAALSRTAETYTFPSDAFQTGEGLYKFECKEEKQQLQGESQGPRQGFVITGNFVLEAVDKVASRIARSLNNLDLGFIFTESDGSAQIMYDPIRKVHIESGGLTTDTGAAPGDDRQMSVALKLGPVAYPALYVDAPEAGWDSLLKQQ